jgi:HD-GYP domain-containing protein (c-di-GMP phosphodiesterase class II)
VIKQHPVDGEAMLAAEPTLRSCAGVVRSHHERMDGNGYPDGLAGTEIPLAARIIAVCDAVDAMSHDRQYRKAIPLPMVFAILREHAGSQWDQEVVRHVMTTVPTMPSVATFDDVGRAELAPECDVQIPDDLGSILESVDAEI